jgi:hypothetical protein
MADEYLARAEVMPVRAAGRWVGDPRSGRGEHQVAQHDFQPKTPRIKGWNAIDGLGGTDRPSHLGPGTGEQRGYTGKGAVADSHAATRSPSGGRLPTT